MQKYAKIKGISRDLVQKCVTVTNINKLKRSSIFIILNQTEMEHRAAGKRLSAVPKCIITQS